MPSTRPTKNPDDPRRTPLGGCCRGRLILKRAADSGGGTRLYWFDRGDPPHEYLDAALRQLLTGHEPVALGDEFYLLCRLPPGDYCLGERAEGGMEVFKVEWPYKHPPRRHGVVTTRKGNGVVKLR